MFELSTGKGVFTARDFCEGEVLLDYDEELITFKEGGRNMEHYPSHLGSYLFLFTFKEKKYW